MIAGLLAATPAAADWDLRQGAGYAHAQYTGDRYQVLISCRRGGGLELSLQDRTRRGDQMDGVTGLMMWIRLPDGRTDRWPVDVVQEGPALSGPLVVGEFQLDFFRNGQVFWIDAPLTGTEYLRGNMKGTGAARLAYLERCGL